MIEDPIPPVPAVIRADAEAVTSFLRARWMGTAALALEDVRQRSGLTRAQLAARLGITEDAVGRMESGEDGRIPLDRYVRWMIACGYMPHEITIYPLSQCSPPPLPEAPI